MSRMQSSSNNEPSGYQLIDFGRGRKLESFGGVVIDRPCPAAHGPVALPEAWPSAQLIYNVSSDRSGEWTFGAPRAWMMASQSLRLMVKPQSSGQVGLFPEHWQQWPWYERKLEQWRAAHARNPTDDRLPRVLHLFAYTGATTLALAAMRAELTHVDAMRSAVEWARENCRSSSMESLPIRWIVDDARKYVDRERKRKKRYELILLDPPSYGHGTEGRAWSIQRDLAPLLEACAELVSDRGIGVVLTGHSPDIELAALHRAVAGPSAKPSLPGLETGQAALLDRAGRSLNCGYVARFLTESTLGPSAQG